MNRLVGLLLAAFCFPPAFGHAQGNESKHDHSGSTTNPAATEADAPPSANELPGSLVGRHGGRLVESPDGVFEVVVAPTGLKLYAVNSKGEPIDLRHSRGLATLKAAGNPKRYRYDLFAETAPNGSAESLAVVVDLSWLGGSEVALAFKVIGAPDAGRHPLSFETVAAIPMTEEQQMAAEIAAQKVCPVSGHPLGSMGEPVPVTIGDKTIYVCCKGCINALKANPATYSAVKPKLTLAPAAEADAAAIALQKVCLVMDEPLGSMGTPLKVIGLDRDVYLCCSGCFTLLEKEPEKYLSKLSKGTVKIERDVKKPARADAE